MRNASFSCRSRRRKRRILSIIGAPDEGLGAGDAELKRAALKTVEMIDFTAIRVEYQAAEAWLNASNILRCVIHPKTELALALLCSSTLIINQPRLL